MDEQLRRREREAHAGDPRSERALERERARSGVPVCQREHGPRPRRICVHLLPPAEGAGYRRHFTGRGVEMHLLCPACEPTSAVLADACVACFDAVEELERCIDFLGEPEVLERPSSLRLARSPCALPGAGPLADVSPIAGGSTWLALGADGRLHEVALEPARVLRSAQATAHGLDPGRALRLHAARDGTLAAVVDARGQRGAVVDARTGEVLLRLDRGDYHPEQTEFPLAFLERGGRTLLVHGTAWNRLDVTDPRARACLSARGPTAYTRGAERPAHYLDYFHGRLLASPDGEWLIDDGWVWHPYGMVRAWQTAPWVDQNAWESEDGASLRILCGRAGYWGGPLCWLDRSTAAVYGFGDDDARLIPSALIYDVPSARVLRWFAGPRGAFFAAGGLLVSATEAECALWDPATGERLLLDAHPGPTHAHPGTGELARLAGGELTRLRVEAGPA